jgi:uncharacterized protein
MHMKKNRREFLKLTGMAGISLAGAGILRACTSYRGSQRQLNKVEIDHAYATLEDGSVLSTPFWRVDSGRDGPSLLLIAAQHGNEIQGAEVARRLMEICASQLVAGSVWLLPMANLLAVRRRRHSFNLGPEENNRLNPEKLHNMQRHWPGDPQGNDTARLTWALDQAIVRHCSHGVDMHCWEHFKAAETLSVTGHEPSSPLGEVTTTRFISYRAVTPPASDKMMVAQLIQKRGGGALVMELSGQFQMEERQVQIGLSSMVNIARQLGMIEGEPELINGPRVERRPDKSHDVPAPCSGIFMPALKTDKSAPLIPDDYVYEGQLLGHIIRESDLTTLPVNAPASGYLWQYGMCHWNLCDASLPAQTSLC